MFPQQPQQQNPGIHVSGDNITLDNVALDNSRNNNNSNSTNQVNSNNSSLLQPPRQSLRSRLSIENDGCGFTMTERSKSRHRLLAATTNTNDEIIHRIPESMAQMHKKCLSQAMELLEVSPVDGDLQVKHQTPETSKKQYNINKFEKSTPNILDSQSLVEQLQKTIAKNRRDSIKKTITDKENVLKNTFKTESHLEKLVNLGIPRKLAHSMCDDNPDRYIEACLVNKQTCYVVEKQILKTFVDDCDDSFFGALYGDIDEYIAKSAYFLVDRNNKKMDEFVQKKDFENSKEVKYLANIIQTISEEKKLKRKKKE